MIDFDKCMKLGNHYHKIYRFHFYYSLVALGHCIEDLSATYLLLEILPGREQNSVWTKMCFFLILIGGGGAKLMLNEGSLTVLLQH